MLFEIKEFKLHYFLKFNFLEAEYPISCLTSCLEVTIDC